MLLPNSRAKDLPELSDLRARQRAVWLPGLAPEIVFDTAWLKTEADWIKAGEIVFHAPVNTRLILS